MLDVEQVSKDFGGVKALSEATCSIREGEIVCLIGPNGSGKTTLFNIITGFLKPDCGKIVFRGSDLLTLPPHHISKIGISRTFQNLRLIRRLSVLDNVLLAFDQQIGEHLSNLFMRTQASLQMEQRNRDEAFSLLEQVELAEKAHNAAEDLSYGQQKLLSIACCLATRADLLLFDEPIAGVSPYLTDRILSLIRDLPAEGKSVIMIEHNLDAAAPICDRMIFMDSGRIVSEGTPEAVRNNAQVIKAYIQ
ncbi:MAG: ABC transporter ATP-binding protein [Armatimonadetes bacterium]|nr:ABC transporter ATP-binding protein [Armatimonadota bacterium]